VEPDVVDAEAQAKPTRATVVLRGLAAVSSGVLLAGAFPLPPAIASLHGSSVAWLALVPLIIVLLTSRPRAGFISAFVAGIVFWLIALSWLLHVSNTFGAPVLIVLGWIAIAVYCALFMGCFGFVVSGCVRWLSGTTSTFSLRNSMVLLVIVPVVWVGTEFVRSHLFTGFPWNALGISQYDNTALVQLAEWGGVFLVSLVVVLVNVSLALTVVRFASEIRGGHRRRRIHLEMMIGLLVLGSCWVVGVRRARDVACDPMMMRGVIIGAVQPCIPQKMKWSKEDDQEIYDALRAQTELVSMGRPDLIVWPETAIPALLRFDPDVQGFVADLAADGAPILVGSMDGEAIQEERVFFNAAFLVDPSGSITGLYRKQHLVPFGEYLPLEDTIPWLKRFSPLGFSCVSGSTPTVFDLPLRVRKPDESEADDSMAEGAHIAFSAMICFEDVFPYLARGFVREGARLLINQTNDAWYEKSAAARQHMTHSIFRAVENRVPVVRCGNTGVTCFIDRVGRVRAILEEEGGGTIFRGFKLFGVDVPVETMPPTLYTRIGDIACALPCFVVAAVLFLLVVARTWRENRRVA